MQYLLRSKTNDKRPHEKRNFSRVVFFHCYGMKADVLNDLTDLQTENNKIDFIHSNTEHVS